MIGLDLNDAPADAIDKDVRPDQIGRDLMHGTSEKRLIHHGFQKALGCHVRGAVAKMGSRP